MASGFVVFTGRSTGTLLAEGGSGCWTASAKRVDATDYVLCTWNSRSIIGEDEGVPHGTAFLVGRISGVARCDREPIPGRARLDGVVARFDRYAAIHVPGVWPGLRSPFIYTDDVEALLGIKLADLEWKTV